MKTAIEIRPLQKGDDRHGFSCGEPEIDRFFEHYAGQNQFKLGLTVTYVAVADRGIVGFATVAASSIERANLPSAQQRKRLAAYPLPVLRLARLGVDTRVQGLGIGRVLLRHVLTLAVNQRDYFGCVGIIADSKPTAVAFYENLGFVPILGAREGLLHGESQPMVLSIDTIAKALAD